MNARKNDPYPFRFYGSGCTDWYEGANGGHCFSAQFERSPEDPEAAALAAAFEQTLATGPADPAGEWRWSGPFARFFVGERSSSGGDCVAQVGLFLRSAHAIVPLVDVVFAGARDGGDAWNDWSMTQAASPAAGPVDPDFIWPGLHKRGIDAKLPALKIRATFEAARATFTSAQADDAFDAALAKQDEKKPKLVEASEEYTVPEARADAHASFDLPKTSRVQVGGQWFRAEGDHPRQLRSGGPIVAEVVHHVRVGTPTMNNVITDVTWVDAAGKRQVPSWDVAPKQVRLMDTHPGGSAALVRDQDSVLWEVDLKDGGPSKLHRLDADHVIYLGDANLLALTHKESVRVLSRKGEGWERLGRGRKELRYGLRSCLGPLGFVATGPKAGVALYRVVGKTLKKIAETSAAVAFAFEKDGELYCHRGARLFKWEGAADAWRNDEKLTQKTAKTSKKSTKAAKPTFLELADLPNAPWAKALWICGQIPGCHGGAVSPKGDAAAAMGSEAKRFHYNGLAYRAQGGDVIDLTEQMAPFLAEGIVNGVHFIDDELLMVRSYTKLFHVTLEPFACELVIDLATIGFGSLNDAVVQGDTIVATWHNAVGFLKRDGESFKLTASLKLPDARGVLFVDGLAEAALIECESAGVHLLQCNGDAVKKVARSKSAARRCLRVEERTYVVGSVDKEVREVLGLGPWLDAERQRKE